MYDPIDYPQIIYDQMTAAPGDLSPAIGGRPDCLSPGWFDQDVRKMKNDKKHDKDLYF